MAERRPMQNPHRYFAASAAVLLLAAGYNVPAIAASSSSLLSAEVSAAALQILAPRAEAEIREVFKTAIKLPMAETKPSADATDVDRSQADAPPGLRTRLPGVSEKDWSLYRKQMYRKDI